MRNILFYALIVFTAASSLAQGEKIISEFKVEGNCEMCEVRIEKAANSVKGVKKADWDLKSNIISVKFDSTITNLNEIQKAISEMGYKTEKFAAKKKGYDALPFCCKVNGACEPPKNQHNK